MRNPMKIIITLLQLTHVHNTRINVNVSRCAELNHQNPVGHCIINDRVYYIRGLHSKKNDYIQFCEWKGFFYGKHTETEKYQSEDVILVMASREFEEHLLKSYDIQFSLFTQFNQTVDAYHMVNYFDRSDIKDNDKSIVIVKKYIHFDLQSFVNHTAQRFIGSTPKLKESVAINQSISLIQQIAIPISVVGHHFGKSYGAISEDKIYVEPNPETYGGTYYLSGLEDVIPSRFYIRKTLGDLIWIAWGYYTQLCHEDILLDVSGNILFNADKVNIFCQRSKALKVRENYSDRKRGRIFSDPLLARQGLVGELVGAAGANYTDCAEYLLFDFIGKYGYAKSVSLTDWEIFEQSLRKIDFGILN